MTKPAARSEASERAHARAVAARRRVLAAGALAVFLAVAVLWATRESGEPAAEPEPPAPGAATAAEVDDESWTVPPSDADLLLAWGHAVIPRAAAALPSDRAVSIDLAVPVTLEGKDVLDARIVGEGRPQLDLDGRVQGERRNLVRLDVPPGWLVPGSYVIEVRTPEKTALPLRRFALIVE